MGGKKGGREFRTFDLDHSTLIGLYMCTPKSNKGFHRWGGREGGRVGRREEGGREGGWVGGKEGGREFRTF